MLAGLSFNQDMILGFLRFNTDTAMTVSRAQRLLLGTRDYQTQPPLRESVYRAMQSLERRGFLWRRGIGAHHEQRWFITEQGRRP